MGFDDLVFNTEKNNDILDVDNNPLKFLSAKKDMEYREKIRKLRDKEIEYSIKRHKIIMEDMAEYRKNKVHSPKVVKELDKLNKLSDENQMELRGVIAQYNSYCNFISKKQ